MTTTGTASSRRTAASSGPARTEPRRPPERTRQLMSTNAPEAVRYAPGALVRARGREWVVQPGSDADLLVLRPLGGAQDDLVGVLPALEKVDPASFPPPTADDLGDQSSA